MFGEKTIILAYHSLSETETGKCSDSGYVSPRQRTPVHLFEKKLHWLSQFADFVSLSDIVTPASSDRWRVTVTFDDGYRDNIELGLPLLRRYEVPVTWFLSTRFIEERNYLPWWDLVDYIAEHVRGMVEVPVGDRDHTYSLDSKPERDQFQRDMRDAFRNGNWASCKALHENLRSECNRFITPPSNAFANRELVMRAASSPWISIGGHTITHLNLASAYPKTVRHEVVKGKKLLQEWVGESISWFAYPYGGKNSHNEVVRRIVRESGFRGAVTTRRGYVFENTDSFQLPRFMVPSWAGMVGFKAGTLALNEVDWIIQNTGKGVDWLRRLLRSWQGG
jgi:peptidoglycan/xylan/chitin deacetylase (PgdA/CDA1 family)